MTLSNEWYNTELENSELETLHRSPTVEYSFYNAVRSGDMEAVIKNCSEDEFIRLEGTGVLSRNALTNIKYHFVVTTAMLTRYCIDGGLEPEQAYRLSDFYILKMDSCKTIRQVADLHHEMAKDFTGKMILQKKSSILSKPLCNVLIIFTVTSKKESRFRFLLTTPDFPRIIFHAFSSRIWESLSAIIFVNRR